jgi:hypothetical protein
MKLTLEERFNLSRYSRKLPCTLGLRLAIGDFLAQIEITADELKTYDVQITPNLFTCNDPDYTVTYESFPQAVVESMKRYVSIVDNEKNADNVLLHKIIDTFKKVI